MGAAEGDNLLAVESLGKPSVFKRFKCDDSLSKWWSNCGRYPDALKWIPNQPIRVSGFSTFAASETTDSSYEMKYDVRVDGDVKFVSQLFQSPPVEEKYFVRVKLDEVIDVPSGG